ncbi:hypothetical protein BBP40_004578 [Aspergillus hancockii]|nr:hypothetical protein BBP40_004578 [Aspergillus hancockii]
MSSTTVPAKLRTSPLRGMGRPRKQDTRANRPTDDTTSIRDARRRTTTSATTEADVIGHWPNSLPASLAKSVNEALVQSGSLPTIESADFPIAMGLDNNFADFDVDTVIDDLQPMAASEYASSRHALSTAQPTGHSRKLDQ